MKRTARLVHLLAPLGLAGLVLIAAPAPAAADRPPPGPVDPYRGEGPVGPGGHPPAAELAPGDAGRPGKAGKRARKQLRRELAARFDVDGDGRLRGPERAAARAFLRHLRHQRGLARLRPFDTNRDGWLSPDEQRAAGAYLARERAERRERRADRRDHRADDRARPEGRRERRRDRW